MITQQNFSQNKKAWVDESKTFVGLESVVDAVEHMLGGTTSGKVVVTL